MIRVVLRREWHGFFRGPSAWLVLALVQFLVAFQFLSLIEQFEAALPRLARLAQAPGLTELVVQPLMMMVAMLLLFVVPMLSMSAIAGERRSNTLCLWQSAPISLRALVLGKWLGIVSVLALIWLSTALLCLTLAWGTELDWKALFSALLGLALFILATSAIGLFFSTLASLPALAALGSFTCLLFLWVCDWSGQFDDAPTVFTRLSMMAHFQPLARGLMDTADIGYFLVLTLGALLLSVWRLDGERRAL
jgi:ABC-2 type transport system permease protein